ncbi:MAG: hypothetical protein RLZ33_2590 [Bacteroidota bacterium]|jgi:hypothetical protein
MLNRLSVFLLIALFLFSCDKEKSALKKINGQWEITSYKRTESNGLSFFATVSGNMTFSEVDQYKSPSIFNTNISYSFDTDNGTIQENGSVEMIEKGDFMNVIKLDASNNPTDTIKYRIMTCTNTDLQLEYSDSIGRVNNLIFKKKK